MLSRDFARIPLQYPTTDRRYEETLTLLPTSADVDDSNGTMPDMSSGFVPGLDFAIFSKTGYNIFRRTG